MSQIRQQKISTSTPKSSSKKCSKIVKTGESNSGDESSATLRSLLGVSPVSVKPSTSPAKPGGGRRKLKEKEELLKNMVNQAKEREASKKRGSMNSSVNTLSLQEVNSFNEHKSTTFQLRSGPVDRVHLKLVICDDIFTVFSLSTPNHR